MMQLHILIIDTLSRMEATASAVASWAMDSTTDCFPIAIHTTWADEEQNKE
jgi:hypothetical protein